LNAAVSSLSGILVNILDATGRVKKTLHLMVIWTILTWVLTPIFILWFGYNGVAAASFVVTLTIAYTVHLVKKIVNFNFFSSIYHPLISAIVMSIIVFICTQIFVRDFFTLLLAIIIGGATYACTLFIFAKDDLYALRNILIKKHD
jgi:O-antigen/teichoic acid export membrane protein